MSEERGFAHAAQSGAAAAAALAGECAIVYGWLRGAAWGWMLAMHFAIVAALAAWCRWWPGVRSDVRLPLLLTAGTAALGPVGPAGTLATIALTRWYLRRAVPFEEWYESLFPDTSPPDRDELAKRIAAADLAKPGSLTPFAEILAFGGLHQKQALLALINRQFRPAFGPILKLALSDGNNAVRVQAATAMNKLENAMLARTLELTARLRDRPGDVATLTALARHYDDCLYSGTLDAGREEELRARALEVFRQCVRAKPDDLDSQLAIGRLLLRDRRYAEAAQWLEQAMAAGLNTSQAGLWYMESLYHLGRFDSLREFAHSRRQALEAAEELPPAARNAVELWGS